MYSGRHSGQPNTPRPGQPNQPPFNGPMSVVNESFDRIKKEFEALQAANHSLRVELERVQAEKNENHKHLVMYYDMSYGLHVDKVRHKEIARRLDGLVMNILPMLSSDQQGHIASALERAKQITPDELNNIISDIGYGAGAEMHPSMNNLPSLGRPLPGTPGLPGLPPNLPHGPPMNLPHSLPPHSMPPHGPHGPLPMPMPPQSLMQPGLNMTSPPNTAGLLTMSGPPNMQNMPPSGLLPGLPGGPLPPHQQAGNPMQIKPENNNPSTCRAASRSSATSDRDQRDHYYNSESKSHHNNSNKKHRRTEENIHINNNSSSLSDDERSEDLVVDGNDDRVETNRGEINRNEINRNDIKVERNDRNKTILVPSGADGHLVPHINNMLPFGVIADPYTLYKDSDGLFKTIPASQKALNDPGLPKGARERATLMHGEVVCAVALSNPTRNIYTGGKGFVKIWSLDNPDSNNGHCSPSIIHKPIAQLPCLDEHTYVRSCKLLDGGKKIVVGGEIPPITIWDLDNGGGPKLIGNLQELANACYALAISPDSKICISCFSDGKVGIYDIHNLKLISSFTGHKDGASCADISSDGNTFFTGGLDAYLKSWNLNPNKMIETNDPLTMKKFSSQIFSLGCSPDYTVLGMEDSIVEVTNIHKEQERMQIKMHDSCVLALKFASSGKWFMTTGKDRLVNICGSPDVNSPLLMKFQESSSVLSCDISGDDRFFATGSGDQKATVYEVTY